MPEYTAYCEDHELKLNPDGSCPECRDSNGQPFPLDMQSIYLSNDSLEAAAKAKKGR
jgi:hypothetical protein